MAPAVYSFFIDWSNNGVFTGTGEDVTARVLEDATITYGRDQARALSPIATGSASFELLNTSKDYSPENASSPITGLVLPGRPVKIQGVLSAVTYVLFQGHLDEFNVLPAIGDRKVSVTAQDALAKLKEAKATTDLYPSIRTGDAIDAILDSIGWSGSLRDLDVGASTLRWWVIDGADAWEAIADIVAAEGSPALITVDGSGNVVFRDRHHRLLDATSTTSQATFRDTGTEPLFSAPLVYDQGWRDVVNDVQFSVDERDPESEITVIWSSDSSFSIASGNTLTIIASSSDPFYLAIDPVSGTDYQVRTGSASVTLSRDQGLSTTISIVATGTTLIDTLQIRGYKVPVSRSIQVTASDSTSITAYGSKSGPQDAGPACAEDAQAIANLAVAYRSTRLPIISFDVIGSSDTRLTQCLTRDLSDRITVVDAETTLNRAFYIEQISHKLTSAGLLHTTTFGCEAISTNAALDSPTTIFIFDHATQGKFGTGKFGT